MQVNTFLRCFDVIARTTSAVSYKDVLASVSQTQSSQALQAPFPPPPSSPPTPPAFEIEQWMYYVFGGAGVFAIAFVSVLVSKVSPRTGAILFEVISTTASLLRGQLPPTTDTTLVLNRDAKEVSVLVNNITDESSSALSSARSKLARGGPVRIGSL